MHATLSPQRLVPLGILLGATTATALGVSTLSTAASPYMAVDEVQPGMKGYGLTVFSGTKPERFDVEIIATLKHFRPNQDLFIVKTTHPRLEVARTVAGMSGSPIYIDGRMIGAYAYGWFFNVEPIAGVTPIHSMLEDLRRPIPYPLAPVARAGASGGPVGAHSTTPAPTALRGTRLSGSDALSYDPKLHAEQVSTRSQALRSPPNGMGLAPATTSVMVGGLGQRSFELARQALEPVGLDMLQVGAAGAGAAPSGPTAYEDGGVVNVQLVRGDISVSGLGTVTHVVKDKLVAFGHPMLGGGVENLPTAVGKIHWILATQNRSFKIGEPTRPLGALVNDRQASIVVHTDRVAPMFPISIKVAGVAGAPKTDWNVEVTADPFLAPNFTAISIGNALETTTAERLDMTWRADSKLHVKGYGLLPIEDFGAGNRDPIGPGSFSRSRLLRALGAILNNPWEEVEIEKIETVVRIEYKQDTRWLRGAHLLTPEVDAGQPARIRLSLVPYHGTPITQVVEVPLPKELAGETVTIQLRPAYTVDRVHAAPENLGQLVHVLRNLDYPGDALIASYGLPDTAAAAMRGLVASHLPPGAADTLGATTDSESPEVFAAERRVVLPMGAFVIGNDSVRVKVREVVR